MLKLLGNVQLTNDFSQALNSLLDDVGKACVTFLLAVLIGALGGRREAFNFALGMWVLSSFFFFFLMLTVESDAKKINLQLVDYRERQQAVKRANVEDASGDTSKLDSDTVASV